eukprot:jgi/Mesvir1/19100/Mv12847-RA.2
MVILWPLLLLLMHAVHGFDNSYDRRDHSAKGRQLQEVRDLHAPGAKDPTKIKLISWSPRAYLYSGFLTPEECDHIMALAKPAMKKSQVVDNETGKSKDSNIRTSSGTFLRRGQDAIIEAIERRVADYSMIPPENGEGMQVLHYELGQKYDAHFDYFHDPVNIRNGGQRIATVLMYLTDVEAGGETVFPNTKGFDKRNVPAAQRSFSDCGKLGAAVKPRKGDALLFWSLDPSTTEDPSSLHSGCPVISGDKWSATKWLHKGEFKSGGRDDPFSTLNHKNIFGFRGPRPPSTPSFGASVRRGYAAPDISCVDKSENCPVWASTGECDKNPEYMRGTSDQPGYCMKSCHACNV